MTSFSMGGLQGWFQAYKRFQDSCLASEEMAI